MNLPLPKQLKIGIQTMYRRTEPAQGPWQPRFDEGREFVELADRCAFDSVWVGDHISFTTPILDPLMQLLQVTSLNARMEVGTGVYLLPLRHPTPVAKQVATLDVLSGGRLIFGVGVGGEFPKEFAACGIPVNERGARLSEGIQVLRKLWSGEAVAHQGRFYSFSPKVQLLPTPELSAERPQGPPIWCGGRSDAALKRAGEMADGYISYVVTPTMFSEALQKITSAAEQAGRELSNYGTGHLLFCCIDDSYEAAFDKAVRSLSHRYAMDFTKATKKYVVLGKPEDIAEGVSAFYQAGVRHIVMDFVGPYEERDVQMQRFHREVRPLLSNLCAS